MGEKLNILVIEDSRTMQRILSNVIYQALPDSIIDLADNGAIAISKVREKQYDLILTDWNMPVMNGLDFVKKYREDYPRPRTPIVMVTTEGGRMEVVNALKAGVNNYIVKPFNAETLKEKLCSLKDLVYSSSNKF